MITGITKAECLYRHIGQSPRCRLPSTAIKKATAAGSWLVDDLLAEAMRGYFPRDVYWVAAGSRL